MKNSPGYSVSGQRVPEGPLVPNLAAFERLLYGNGYAPTTVCRKVRLVRDFSAWLSRQTINIKDLTLGQGERYLRYRARHRRPGTDDIAGLKQLLELLCRKGVVAQAFMERKHAFHITQSLLLSWPRNRKLLLPSEWAKRLSWVRGFARYQSAVDPRTEIPPKSLLPYRPHACWCAASLRRGKRESWRMTPLAAP